MHVATVIPAESVETHMGDPVVVTQAPPDMRDWGYWRMPKLFRMPTGEIWLSFHAGQDAFEDQGKTATPYCSTDDGATWKPTKWPHPSIGGISPVVTRIHDGDYYAIPCQTGFKLDMKRMPKPFAHFAGYFGSPMYRLEDCPQALIDWMRDMKAVRWSAKTKRWEQESIKWDHRGQLVRDNNSEGYTQKSMLEAPIARLGDELLLAQNFMWYQTDPKRPPLSHECHLMVSKDNGRSWKIRSTLHRESTRNDGTGEPAIVVDQGGVIIAVLRTDRGKPTPMYLLHSQDRGHTWSEPEKLFRFGVQPVLQQMDNGVLVLSFGRPGNWVSFSLDGGYSWTEPRAILEKGETDYAKLVSNTITYRYGGDTSGGYTSLLEVGKDSFLIAYTDFNYPNENGRECKTILVRRIAVNGKSNPKKSG